MPALGRVLRARRARLLLAAALLAAACSPSGGERRTTETDAGGGVAERGAVAIDDFCGDYVASLCVRVHACNLFGEIATPWDDCAEWAKAVAPQCDADLPVLARSDAVHYRPTEAGRCLDELDSMPCRELFAERDAGTTTRPGCLRTVFPGEKVEGDGCRDDVECEAPLTCDLSGGCPGRCAPPSGPPTGLVFGDPCGDVEGTCFLGLACLRPAGADEGAPAACSAWRALGETCGPGEGECRPGETWCPRSGEGAGRCQHLPGAGETCGEAEGLSAECAGSVCDTDIGRCRIPIETGGKCNADRKCASWRCGRTLECLPLSLPEDACPSGLTVDGE